MPPDKKRRRSPSEIGRTKGGASRRRIERHRLAEAQNWRCAYCGVVMSMDIATTEHVVPFCLGGTNDWHNKVAACRRCNEQRGNAAALIAAARKGSKPEWPSRKTARSKTRARSPQAMRPPLSEAEELAHERNWRS